MRRLRGPSGTPNISRQTVEVNSGNRSAFACIVTLLGVLAADNAGRVAEDGAGTIWQASELVDLAHSRLSDASCDLTSDPDSSAQHTTEGAAGRLVSFQWNPETSELSFDTRAQPAVLPLSEGATTAATVQPAHAYARDDCD
jgi:hypothetical protein